MQTQARPVVPTPLAAPGRTTLPVAGRDAALAAAAALTATGRGDIWTLAIAFGVSDASAVTALVVALVGVATIARTGSAALSDIAGGQAVLGAAGFTGSAIAVAAAWTSAVSLVLAARDRWTGVVLGAFAGAIVAGPSLAGGAKSAAVWVAGVAVGGIVGGFAAPKERRERWQRWLAVVVAIAAVCLGVVAGYR
ncbi:MAG: hypothetical protein H0U92_14800 [Actinobacteria bacterium]|nr:hypothetical protein [Actinomycetota bacterium]